MAHTRFDYVPPPSLQEFFRSDRKLRFVRGPIGCVPQDTEFLTPTGWKAIGNYALGDKVAQWHPSGEATWVLPLDYIKVPATELFYEFRNKHSLHMVLSGEHRVPHYNWNGKFKVITAAKLAQTPSTREIPTHFTPCRSGIDLTDDMLRLAVCLNADGTLPPASAQITFTFRKARKKKRFTALLRRLGAEWTEYHNPNRPTEIRYTVTRRAHPLLNQKRFDGQWWDASPRQLAIIYEECLHWDGMPNHAEERFTSSHPEDADYIQYVAHALGRRATIKTHQDLRPGNEHHALRYTVHITTPDSCKRAVRVGRTTEISRVASEDGFQYCFEVPTGFFLARHNGRVFVTGNSTKSTAMAMELLRRAAQQAPDEDGVRRTKFSITRNTLQQLRETCLVTIRKVLGPLVKYKVSEQKIIIHFNDIETEWLLLPLDTPQNIEKLLSLELTGAWVSEFRQIDPEIVINIFSRCGRYPAALSGGVAPTWYGLIAETNSFTEDSPWYEKLELELPGNWGYFIQPGAYDEAADWLQYLPPNYYEDLREANGELWSTCYIDNEITASLSSQAVFADSFKPDLHLATELEYNPNKELVIGMDVGRQPAATFGQRDSYGRLLILGSIAAENVGILKFMKDHVYPYVAKRFPRAVGYAVIDPAARNRSQIGEKSVLQVINDAGLTAVLANTNDIAPRLRAVEAAFYEEDGILIDRGHNVGLIKALMHDYRYSRSKDKALKEIPEKSHPASDLCDSLQYFSLGVDSPILAQAINRRTHTTVRPDPPSGGWA